MVFAPLVNGEVGVLPRHAPLIARMKSGEVRVRTSYRGAVVLRIRWYFRSAAARVTVLADTAIRAKDLDEAAALTASSVPKRRSRTASPTSTTPRRRPSWLTPWRNSTPFRKLRDKTSANGLAAFGLKFPCPLE